MSRRNNEHTNSLTGAVDPTLGSYQASGLDGDVFFDRIGRLQAYGLGQFDASSAEEFKQATDLDWDAVRWGELQDQCAAKNKR